jgi:hypothetical protein
MDREEYIRKTSRIADLEYMITKKILKDGHKSSWDDEFKDLRGEILNLRIEVFPDSVWVKVKKELEKTRKSYGHKNSKKSNREGSGKKSDLGQDEGSNSPSS